MQISEIEQFKPLISTIQQNTIPPNNNPVNEVTQGIESFDSTKEMTNGGESFADTLSSFISDVNHQQKTAHSLTEKMIKGEPVELHDIIIAGEKAKTSFQLLVEIRNKFLDMYKEISRLQV